MCLLHNFDFDGKDSREFKLYFVGKKLWKKPERDVTIVHVPGKDGDVIIDNGSYKNFTDTISLRLFAPLITGDVEADYYNALQRVKDWLVVDGKYHKISESYNSDYYREIRIKSFSAQQLEKNIADIKLTIDCKPYMRRKSGDFAITATSSIIHIFNPESENAKPYMKIVPSDDTTDFSIAVNNETYAFYRADGYVEIDSDDMNVYKGTINKNSDYAATSFPSLKSGDNTIALIGNISRVEIIPRWRTI